MGLKRDTAGYAGIGAALSAEPFVGLKQMDLVLCRLSSSLSAEPFVGLKHTVLEYIGIDHDLSAEPFVGLKQRHGNPHGPRHHSFSRTLCGFEADRTGAFRFEWILSAEPFVGLKHSELLADRIPLHLSAEPFVGLKLSGLVNGPDRSVSFSRTLCGFEARDAPPQPPACRLSAEPFVGLKPRSKRTLGASSRCFQPNPLWV